MEFLKLSKERNGECLDLVWEVFSEFEVPVFPPEGGPEYKRIIEETREKKNICFLSVEIMLCGVKACFFFTFCLIFIEIKPC